MSHKGKAKQHWLFGYGSLMSHDSRRRFTDIDAPAIPVLVYGWHRAWSMCCPVENYTCVGAVPHVLQQGTEDQKMDIGGVIVPIEEITESLRKREQNYHFVELEVSSIRHFHEEHQPGISEILQDAVVWICQVSSPGSSNVNFPVYQSYIDTCIAGCLESANEAFAVKFIEETHMWESYWLNDRGKPQYARAAEVTRDVQNKIDDLLQQFDLLKFRRDVS